MLGKHDRNILRLPKYDHIIIISSHSTNQGWNYDYYIDFNHLKHMIITEYAHEPITDAWVHPTANDRVETSMG